MQCRPLSFSDSFKRAHDHEFKHCHRSCEQQFVSPEESGYTSLLADNPWVCGEFGMLTAWDTLGERLLVLPDYETRDQLEAVREQARAGALLCPTCRQLLWLRAGDLRTPHFGHRSLNDCPAATVSEAVLAARRQLYRFFRVRIEAGKLQGEIDLEPQFPPLASVGGLDMLLRRSQKPPVAIGIVERSLKPETRAVFRSAMARRDFLYRPVFLHTRLKPAPDGSDQFLLDTTQRELQRDSPYNLHHGSSWRGGGTLHFIDAIAGRWTTLRGLTLIHEPQLFAPSAVRESSLGELLWSEAYGEWVHPGEAEALKAYREAEAEKLRRKKEPPPARVLPRRPMMQPSQPAVAPPVEEPEPVAGPAAVDEPKKDESPSAELLEEEELRRSLAWLSAGLVCIGCGQRTPDWQNASPGKDACVCRACFVKGVRLG
jgi:hypothetical protein